MERWRGRCEFEILDWLEACWLQHASPVRTDIAIAAAARAF